MEPPVLKPFKARVVKVQKPRVGARWLGSLIVRYDNTIIALLMPASIARWLSPQETVEVILEEEPEKISNVYVAARDTFKLYRFWNGDKILVWPPWSRRTTWQCRIGGKVVYEYNIVAREAVTEEDYKSIVELEQHHYASKEEIVAIWRCPICGKYFESNIQPKCPEHGIPAKLQEVRGSLPSSRFLILELAAREEYEPKVIAYVRVDTPIPLMHRRLIVNGKVVVERMIREKVFPRDWFHPTFWPVAYNERITIVQRYRELAKIYGSRRIARAAVGEEIADEALRRTNTAAARIARVVVHPDYRGDGIGVLAVKLAIEWIKERRIPEMKREKHIVETIAQMARFNPFFEKAGFVYMWDTASGRPVLMYPLTNEAKRFIEKYLKEDPFARKHGGRLFKSRIGAIEKINAPIVLENVTKVYRSEVDTARLGKELQEVLRAFGAEKRVIEKYIFRNINLRIEPGEVVAVIGASGAGKTTLLRLIIGAIKGIKDENYKPTEGKISIPSNAKLAYILPGEHEPVFGDETILEHVYHKTKDVYTAIEVLNTVGLSDAIFYRARFDELSTGQKERAKLASLLAEKPNIIIIDEFCSHLDKLTAMRVARKLSSYARRTGTTLIVSTHRTEILEALSPDKIVLVGYGTVHVKYGRQEHY